MAYQPTAQPHGHCTSKTCVEWLGLLPTEEDGSANATGRAAELLVLDHLRACGITASHQPSSRWVSPDDKGLRPDYAMWIPTDGADCDADELDYGAVFAVGELKLQRSSGSAYQKVEHAIRRYAHLSDERNVTAIIIHMMCPVITGAGTLEELAVLADYHGVGWIGFDEISPERVAQVTANVTKARRRKVAQARMDELIAELGLDGIGSLSRYAVSAELTSRRETASMAALRDLFAQDDLFDLGEGDTDVDDDAPAAAHNVPQPALAAA